MKVLITGGGCEEAVDTVRSLCNFSTGKTSTQLAEIFAAQGCQVTALMGKRAVKPEETDSVCVREYVSFSDLHSALKEELSGGNYDAVIHAAAVADYSPDVIEADGKEYKAGQVPKITGVENLVIHLKKNPKLVDSLKIWGGKNLKVVAFKLTSQATQSQRLEAVNKVRKSSDADYVVSNDLSEIKGSAHPCRIYDSAENYHDVQNVAELGAYLLEVLK